MKPVKSSIKAFFFRAFYTLLIVQLFTVGNTYSQNFSFTDNRKKDAIHFILIKNLIIIPIYINQKGPYNFILDTGVSPLLITDPSILDSLDFKKLRSVKLSGLGAGEDIDAFLSNSVQAKIGEAYIPGIPTAILKKDIFNLTSYVGLHIYGLIGYHFFNSFLVKINYPAKKLSFYLPEVNTKKKGEKIPITLINDKPYLNCSADLLDSGTIPLKVIADLGASHALSLESYHQKPFPLPPVNIPANLGMGIGGHISGNVARIPVLKIGNFILRNVLTSFPRYEDAGAKIAIKERNGNLGADALKHFHLTIDYKNLAFYLKPNRYYKNSFEHDMSGMEVHIEEHAGDHYIIGRIEPASPAALADILPQDEILSVNLARVNQLSLEDISGILKSGNNRLIFMEIFRDNKVLIKIFRLKRRI